MTTPAKIESAKPRQPRFDIDFWAYLLPMALFLGITQVGVSWKGLYVHSYVAKTVIVASSSLTT